MSTKTLGTSMLSEGRITEEGIQRLRDLQFHELRRPFILNTELNFDAVRRFCWGLGDDNPLWLDPEYAAGTVYAGPALPQHLLYSTHPTYMQIGLPGVHGLHAGTAWRMHAPIPLGAKPQVLCWIHDVQERESKLGGIAVWVYFRAVYADQSGQVLAESLSYSIRSERARSRKSGKTAGKQMKVWDEAEIAEVEERILGRVRRGATERTWESVQVGDRIDDVLKGPLCSTDMISWYAGSSPAFSPAHETALRHYRKHPKWAFRNPRTGILEPNIRVHENLEAAQSSGLAGPYDVGIQRHQWAFQALYDWAGDNAFVKTCDAQFRGLNYFGDLTTISGTVTGKQIDADGDHVVEITWQAANQDGQVTMPGTAVVALPTGAGPDALAGPRGRVLQLDEFLRREVPDLVRIGTTS